MSHVEDGRFARKEVGFAFLTWTVERCECAHHWWQLGRWARAAGVGYSSAGTCGRTDLLCVSGSTCLFRQVARPSKSAPGERLGARLRDGSRSRCSCAARDAVHPTIVRAIRHPCPRNRRQARPSCGSCGGGAPKGRCCCSCRSCHGHASRPRDDRWAWSVHRMWHHVFRPSRALLLSSRNSEARCNTR